MLFPKIKIEIEGAKVWQFNAVSLIEIEEDMDTLTDNCKIELPKKIKWEGEGKIPVKRGDKVKVFIGYDEPKLKFTGYIKQVGTRNPIVLECEDSMYKLKLTQLQKKGYKNTDLKTLIGDMLGGAMPFQLIDNINLGGYRITQDTVAKELDELRDEFGLKAYIRNIKGTPTLYVGLGYPLDNRNTYKFEWGKNLTTDNYDLDVQEKANMKLQVKAISVQADNSRVEVTEGDSGGDTITVYKYGVTKKELEQFAKNEVDRLKYTGLKGSFGTLGEPAVTKTDIVELSIPDVSDGKYLVKKVVTSAGGSTFFNQVITIGQPIKV